ncbi:uncharacterized protein RHO17_014569 [Thomomys bottae]
MANGVWEFQRRMVRAGIRDSAGPEVEGCARTVANSIHLQMRGMIPPVEGQDLAAKAEVKVLRLPCSTALPVCRLGGLEPRSARAPPTPRDPASSRARCPRQRWRPALRL